jgi:hypothetical protein
MPGWEIAGNLGISDSCLSALMRQATLWDGGGEQMPDGRKAASFPTDVAAWRAGAWMNYSRWSRAGSR